MAEQENNGNSQSEKKEVKKQGAPKFGKARIVVPQASREAARSNMAGEAMVKSMKTETAPVAEPDTPALEITPLVDMGAKGESRGEERAENNSAREPVDAGKSASPAPEGKKARAAARKAAPSAENQPEETKNVRLLSSLWLDAKFNLVQLNGSGGPSNLTDYAEEAFRLYEKHLLKTGKINRSRTDK
ncbi:MULTISPECIES: hypothetical protein [Rufibacter]|uniref:Uncharacterized protein n=1 Tax=Rufibacter quisquiliarum TaxID=1549639 RepID=A0A839GHK3_9BACT|nr:MULTISPECIES: hypothetical protein [Rufibacter]MBA9079134.1 hypothetical protein [Rufibacter quisquiliarum]